LGGSRLESFEEEVEDAVKQSLNGLQTCNEGTQKLVTRYKVLNVGSDSVEK
jgi:hypothetical protein